MFSACYAAFTGLAVVSLVLNLCVKEATTHPGQASSFAAQNVHVRVVLKNEVIVLAMVVAAVGYGLMNLLMIQASMHMSNMHVHFSDVSMAIQWHVLAMFAPSFVTGFLIQRLGLKAIIFSGVLLLLASSTVNITSQNYLALTISLIALGLGWNFTYVGGSALLTQALESTPELSVKVQGLNDFGISVMATLGAFAPAFLLTWLGWNGTNLLGIALCLALLVFSAVVLGRCKLASAL